MPQLRLTYRHVMIPHPNRTDIDLVAHALRSSRALAFAVRTKDRPAWLVSASRLREALQQVMPRMGITGTAQHLVSAMQLHTVATSSRIHRETAPTRLDGAESERVMQWTHAKTSLGTVGAHADLFQVDATDHSVPLTMLADLFILRCKFSRTSFAGSHFDNAVFDSCNFARANLRTTSWRAAQLTSCQAIGADFRDASIGYAIFTDCDLRGADFRATQRTDLMANTGAVFVRCDLRASQWDQRRLVNMTFHDCRFHQMKGKATPENLVIVRPDLSQLGDGSRIGTASEVIAMWSGTTDPADAHLAPLSPSSDRKDAPGFDVRASASDGSAPLLSPLTDDPV
jgi:Pentapeptide repeats (9 copies)